MKKCILFSLLLFGIAVMTSCIQRRYVFPGNTPYRAFGDIISGDEIRADKVKKGFMAKVTEKEGYILIEVPVSHILELKDSAKTQKIDSRDVQSGTVFWDIKNKSKMLFLETKYADTLQVYSGFKTKKTFSYFSTSPSFQAMTIPLKIRPRLSDPALLDSFPAQAEAGINIGLSAGWRFSFHIFSTRKNIFGSYNNTISLTPGIFLGAGVTELSAANTRPVVQFNRKAVMLSPGGYFMIGFNFLNLGYAFGFDFATGKDSGDWLYKGKMWHGIIFAITIK